jgi:hypothetical protein
MLIDICDKLSESHFGCGPRCIFWPIFVRFRKKLKIELFKKTINILNFNAHRGTKIIFKNKKILKIVGVQTRNKCSLGNVERKE